MTIMDDGAIRALIARLAYLSDEGPLDEYATVYTPDATWTGGGTTSTGLAEIIASSTERRNSGAIGPGSHARHMTIPVNIEISGDTARGTSYFMLLTAVDSAPQVTRFAVYDDEFVRTGEGWRVSRRTIRKG